MVGHYNILQHSLLKFYLQVPLVKIRRCISSLHAQEEHMSNEVCVKSRVTLLCSHARGGFLSSSMIFCSIDWPTKQWEIETSHLVIPQSKLHCNKFLCFIKPQSSWLLDYQFMINNLPSVDQAHPGHCCVICPWLSGLRVCITAVLKALLSMDLLAFFMWDIYDAISWWGSVCFLWEQYFTYQS